MSHSVTAIVAPTSVAESLALAHPLLVSVPLVEGISLIPVEDDDMDALIPPSSGAEPGFVYLSSGWRCFLAKHAAQEPLVYLETEYFGGAGTQAAASFFASSSPQFFKGAGAINRALQSIGIVSKIAGLDEFDYVGLSRYRHTEDWKEQAKL